MSSLINLKSGGDFRYGMIGSRRLHFPQEPSNGPANLTAIPHVRNRQEDARHDKEIFEADMSAHHLSRRTTVLQTKAPIERDDVPGWRQCEKPKG